MKKPAKVYLILFLLIAIFFILSLSLGTRTYNPLNIIKSMFSHNLSEIDYNIIFKIRLYRTLLAFIVGFGLSIAGVSLQAILRNPLAEPYILGISSGAGLGLVIGFTSGFTALLGIFGYIVPAFVGALFSIIVVYTFATIKGKVNSINMILSGVIFGVIASGIMVFILSLLSSIELHNIMGWLLGSLEIYDLKLIIQTIIYVFTGCFIIFLLHKELDILILGDEKVITMGLNVNKIKKVIFLLSSFITAGIVSITGIIGFVGLVIPHTTRIFFTSKHKNLIPLAGLIGGLFLIICGILSRIILPPNQIPIGVITGIIGGPYFLFALRKKII
jgi:iron complex transport system permease protein